MLETPTSRTRGVASPSAAMPPAGAMSLATSMSPPLRLPGEHFAAALAFWILGSAGLVWVAPDLARGAFTLPRVAAVTHLFTLGWITITILGALYQFLPVALRTPIRSATLAEAGLVLFVPGFLLFLGGLLFMHPPVMVGGAVAFGCALLLFVGNLAATLHRAPERNLSWWCLVGAAGSLVSTIVLGASLAGNLRWGYLGADRFLAVAVHLHVAVGGWVLLTVVGVAHRLLPMFLLSHGASERPAKLSAGLLAFGIGLLLVTHHRLNGWLILVIGLALGGGVAALLVQAASFFRHRRKPVLDPGLRLAAAGLALLGAAVFIAPFFLEQGLAAPRIATGYVVALLGALSLFVAGHYYKILPFLIWFHRFGALVGKQPVPRVADLYGTKLGNAAAALLVAGTVGLVAGALAGAPLLARAAASLYLAGAVIHVSQMISISRRRPA